MITTVGELFAYIHYSKNKDGNVTLPNNITCNISELYDFICISYLATHILLTRNNIYPADMHPGNIFIHWLGNNSYHGDKNIKNIKEIIYKIEDKYYKIKTFGFVIILGDTGAFIIKIKKDVIIIGQAPDIKNNYLDYDMRMQEKYSNMDFIKISARSLTPKQYQNTVAYEIMKSVPYCDYPISDHGLLGTELSYINKMKSTIELLEFYYDKYGVQENDLHKNRNKTLILTLV